MPANMRSIHFELDRLKSPSNFFQAVASKENSSHDDVIWTLFLGVGVWI